MSFFFFNLIFNAKEATFTCSNAKSFTTNLTSCWPKSESIEFLLVNFSIVKFLAFFTFFLGNRIISILGFSGNLGIAVQFQKLENLECPLHLSLSPTIRIKDKSNFEKKRKITTLVLLLVSISFSLQNQIWPLGFELPPTQNYSSRILYSLLPND